MKNQALREALALYLTPITAAANETRARLGLPAIDITVRPEIEHKIEYFANGYSDGVAGYYDRIYDDRKDYAAYRAGNMAGRELYKGENFQLI